MVMHTTVHSPETKHPMVEQYSTDVHATVHSTETMQPLVEQ